MYYLGAGIFFVVAILCVVAFVKTQQRRRAYEGDDAGGDDYPEPPLA